MPPAVDHCRVQARQIARLGHVDDDAHHGFGAVRGGAVVQGARFGNCGGNVQPVVQFSIEDPFWRANEFRPVDAAATGCGFALQNVPGLVALGGWDPQNVSLGYVDIGAGRLWMVEANWQDNNAQFTDESRDLMAAMISGLQQQ